MGEPKSIEKRRHIRHPLTSDLTGSIVSVSSGSPIPCVAMDVSMNGMRVIMTLNLEHGTELLLRMNGQEIPLTVVWSTKETTRKGYFSCGLMTKSPHDNLETVFTAVGMIKGDA